MINEEINSERVAHNVVMESRKKMMITGVSSVENFDEQAVSLQTSMGALTIKGSELKVDKLNVATGELNVRGNIIGMVYSDSASRGGLLTRMFK